MEKRYTRREYIITYEWLYVYVYIIRKENIHIFYYI